jgi:hypothetical protein
MAPRVPTKEHVGPLVVTSWKPSPCVGVKQAKGKL